MWQVCYDCILIAFKASIDLTIFPKVNKCESKIENIPTLSPLSWAGRDHAQTTVDIFESSCSAFVGIFIALFILVN